MGLINNDVYVASNGVEKVGTYISFASETLYLRQSGSMGAGQPNVYSVNANYRIYWDQECREVGKSFIDLKSVSVSVSKEQLSGNLYALLYDALKVVYPNTTDELSRVAPPASAPVAPVSAPVAPVSSDAAPVAPVSSDVAPVAPVSSDVAPVAPVSSDAAPVAPVSSDAAPVSSDAAPVAPVSSDVPANPAQ